MEQVREYVRQLLETKDCIYLADFDAFSFLSPQDVYEIMSDFERQGQVESVLETRCTHCDAWTGKYYEGFWMLPKEEVCPACGKTFDNLVSEASYLVWKVLK